jgi:hypothetical protein
LRSGWLCFAKAATRCYGDVAAISFDLFHCC